MHKKNPPLFLSVLVLLIVGASIHGQAQLWSGILSPGRAVDWTVAGIPGGIPDASWTQCGPAIGAGATAAQINSQIAGCGPNTYVLLGSGTFKLTSGITINQSNVVLRGSGPTSTTVNFSGVSGSSCGGNGGNICAMPSNNYMYIGSSAVLPPSGSNQCSWTAGYAQGTTSITLSSCGSSPTPALAVGQVIILDQANDGASKGTAEDTGGVFICDYYSGSSNACQSGGTGNPNGRQIGGATHSQTQVVTITSLSGSRAGPYTVGITPPLKATNWRSAQSPGAWWTNRISSVGFENMTVNYANSTSPDSGIYLYDCDSCWVENVNSQDGNRNHVWLYQSTHDNIQDSYFFTSQNHATESYGVESLISSDVLVQNNIFQMVSSPVLFNSGEGNVISYNFSINDYYTPDVNWQQNNFSSHNAAAQMNLWEGNQFEGSIYCDNTWGTSNLVTFFRDRVSGQGHNGSLLSTQNSFAVALQQGCRGFNVIGSVLGTAGYHNNYQITSGSTNCDTSIYNMGFAGTECRTASNISSDPLVSSTLMRWGNYDTVNAAVRFNSAESAPSAAGSGSTALAGNSTPASQTLPPSLYLASKPSWFGSNVYPPIGPDVTGGTGPGGFSYNIPAAACYYSQMAGPANGYSTSPLTFDAGSCYTSSQVPAPTNLTTVVH